MAVVSTKKTTAGSSSTLSSPPRDAHPSSSAMAASLTNGITTHSKKATSSIDGLDGKRSIDLRILEARKKLPIWIGRQSIIKAVQENDTVVILGETGSGKTTQIPQYLYEAGLTASPNDSAEASHHGGNYRKQRSRMMIGITQPRRVAAISLAKRVAVEMGVPEPDRIDKKRKMNGNTNGVHGAVSSGPSDLVGYSIRFDDRSSQHTRIKFMTDGRLLREMLSGKNSKSGKERRLNDYDITIKSHRFAAEDNDDDDVEEKAEHNLLEQYSVLIIDEAHERSVHTDVVLGLAKRIQKRRKRIRENWIKRQKSGELESWEQAEEPTELKVVIMSATIDAQAFANFFHDAENKPAPILYIKGRQFPIKLYHSQDSCQNWIESCKKLIVQINEMPPGDVLIFMTGAEEIESFANELQELNHGLQLYAEGMGKGKAMSLIVVKLYAALGGEAIRNCFLTTPPGCRKIVLATNIAETSITISGIKYVIDCGLAKERTFRNSLARDQQGVAMNSITAVSGAFMDMLEIKPISKSAARQRMGRAGRETGGSCFRLYKEEAFENMEESTLPEILRTDLSSVVLDVFAMGIDPVKFDWLDRPEEEGLRSAVINLVELGALEMATSKEGQKGGGLRLTKLGKQMASLPLLPQLSKTLLSARDCEDTQVMSQALNLVSILSTEKRSILIEPTSRSDEEGGRKRDEADRARERFSHPSGDHATQLQALYAFFQAERESAESIPNYSTSNGKAKMNFSKLKEWCSLNFISLKTVREALKIRNQLYRICLKEAWLPTLEVSMQLDNEDDAKDSDSNSNSSNSDDDLVITKGSRLNHSTDSTANENTFKDDFEMLRRCMIQGKRVNTAFRQGESNLYQRAHGGSERFKIHPSSSLLFQKNLPNVIFFEDIFVTSQIFARTVSAAEASWLADLSGEVKNRKNLNQASLATSISGK